MQPSSLIFLVIIAIWAAYLLQHWVRRREHLATARSVDRFSDAMRVLERRGPLMEAHAASLAPRSYAVSPTRPSRPEGQVHRPPAVAEQAHQVRPEPLEPEAGRSGALRQPAGHGAPGVAPHRRHLAGVPARRLRGLSFLGSLVLLLLTLPLAGFGVLGWWSSVAALGLLLADLAWLRHAAQAERAARRAAWLRAREDAGVGLEQRRAAPSPSTARPSGRTAAPAPRVPDTQHAAAPAGTTTASTGSADAEPEPATIVDPDAWQPVPVPKPTYTMKARAMAPSQPAPVPPPAPAPTFGAVVAEGELDGLLDRRAAAGA